MQRSWLNWLGIRLPPSPNESPTTRRKRLRNIPRNKLWPSEEENWRAAQENMRREEWEEMEARIAAEFDAIEQQKARRVAKQERIERLLLSNPAPVRTQRARSQRRSSTARKSARRLIY
jgi:hypothetical protein